MGELLYGFEDLGFDDGKVVGFISGRVFVCLGDWG